MAAHVTLSHPFSMVLAGPSKAGKTTFVKRLIDHADQMIQPTIARVVFCYANWQPAYETMLGVEFYEGLDVIETLKIPREPTLLVIDDFMTQSERICEIFTRYSHHANLSVVHITQNLYHQGKGNREINLNAGYLVVFKNPRDYRQIFSLSQQIYPTKPKFLVDAYSDAVRKPFGYLFLDLTQQTEDRLRYRGNIFPGEEQVAWVPKKT